MSLQQSIWTLAERGWSNRRIARELGVDRYTVSRWRRKSSSSAAKVTPGSTGGADEPNAAKVTAGSNAPRDRGGGNATKGRKSI